MLFNIVLVSAIQQLESAITIYIYIYISPLPLEPGFPILNPIPLGHHSVPGWAPCVTEQLPVASCFTRGSVYMSVLLDSSYPLLPLPCLQVHFLPLCLHIPPDLPFMASGLDNTYFRVQCHLYVCKASVTSHFSRCIVPSAS